VDVGVVGATLVLGARVVGLVEATDGELDGSACPLPLQAVTARATTDRYARKRTHRAITYGA
jgi:hypothetical protein